MSPFIRSQPLTDDKWEHLRITRPRLWERRQETIDGIKDSIERIRQAREAHEIPMMERVQMAREMVGELAQEIEVNEDGSVTVHIAPLH
ncbi:hypothetical protein [Rhizobium esperanzae]|uniref:hypothetical protein n=1 Tax=Rhizobium esperanzae TaxID=1967781 RepID=UPI00113116B7|nr:hypothetical protein [Rhizobium esperanzae]